MRRHTQHGLNRNRRQHAPDVALLDQDARVVDGLGQTLLEDAGLQAAVQELLDREVQHVIELLLVLRKHIGVSHPRLRVASSACAHLSEHTLAGQAAQQGSTLEHALGVL